MLRKMINELTTATNYKYYTKREFLQLFYKTLLMICETCKVLGKKQKRKEKPKKQTKVSFSSSPVLRQCKKKQTYLLSLQASLVGHSATGNPNIIHTTLIDITIY